MDRRKFVKNTLAASSSIMAFRGFSSFAAQNEANTMPYGTLGRTGVKVSKLAIGCAPLGKDHVTQEDVNKVLDRAIEEDINYLDTAPNYRSGTSEKRLGEAMLGRREKFFLVTKTEEASYKGTWELLEQSLDRMQTDYIDLIHLHNLGHQRRFPDIREVFGKNGAMQALREAKKKGKLRFIGASGHVYPSRFHYALDSGEIDVLMNAVNYVLQHSYDFEHKIWTRALEENIGLVAMKVLGGQQQSKFKLPEEDYEIAFRYALSLKGLATAVVGLESEEHLLKAIEQVKNFKPLTKEEFIELSMHGLDIMKKNKRWRSMHGEPVT